MTRRTEFELAKAKARAHILKGYSLLLVKSTKSLRLSRLRRQGDRKSKLDEEICAFRSPGSGDS